MAYFRGPRVLFGSGMLKKLGKEFAGIENKKAALITDKVMGQHCRELVEALEQAGFEVSVWDGAEPEPKTDVAEAGSEFLKGVKPGLVVAFGGGSSIDTAKAAWILYERPDISFKDILPQTRLNLRKRARFLAVPTTSGTGSEMNWAMVISEPKYRRKLSFGNDEIIPDAALLIPEFTAGMPPALTASTGMDVLGHAVDGLTARQQNDFSDALCLQAIRLVFAYLPEACRNGNDMVAREKMQNAAAIAGMGFGNSNTSLSHALGHALGAAFHIGHGRTIGLALAPSIEFIISRPPLPKTPDPAEKLALAARMAGINESDPETAVKLFVEKIRVLQAEIGEPLSLQKASVKQSDFNEKLDTLAGISQKDVSIYSCPCECTEEDLKNIFRAIFGDTG